MESVFVALFNSLPFVLAFVFAVLAILASLTFASKPLLAAFPFLVVMYSSSEITYGQLEQAGNSIYTRGAGLLIFPAMAWAVFFTIGWFVFIQKFRGVEKKPIVNRDIHYWFAAWLLLLVFHVCTALWQDAPFRDAVAPSGFSSIVLMWLFMLLILMTVRDASDVKWLLRFMLVAGLTRAIFGLVRWAAFEGDPSNAYANRHGLSLRLTFFDIYDSLICFLTVAISALKLFRLESQKSQPSRTVFLWFAMLVPIACILLSFRRTAFIGLILGGALITMYLPLRTRIAMLFVAIPSVMAGGAYTVWKRLSQTKNAGGLNDFFFDITSQAIGSDSPRLLELKLAWASFLDNPIFGVGSWGSYEGWRLVSWQLYEGGGGSYLHSGILHVGLKSGLIGLVLFFGVVASFTIFWRKISDQLSKENAILAIIGVAGLVFVLPDFLIGTSITKYRSTYFIGLCLALPYVAWFAQHRMVTPRKTTRQLVGRPMKTVENATRMNTGRV